jgi:DNA-binding transcriptional regulator YiaG
MASGQKGQDGRRRGVTVRPGAQHDITPSRFIRSRRAARLSRATTSALLGVSLRTLRNWENGVSRIPYAAFKLLRLLLGEELPAPGWDRWSIREGVLVAPNGYTYEAWQLEYIQWVFAAARLWLNDRQQRAATMRAGLPSSLTRTISTAVLFNRRAAPKARSPRKRRSGERQRAPAPIAILRPSDARDV